MMLYASRPYDMVKLLLRIALGEDSRPVITSIEENIVVLNFNDDTDEEISVTFDHLDNEYVQTIFTDENGIYDLSDYQKYIYEMSRITLVSTVLKVIEIQSFMHEYNLSYPPFMSEYETILYKLSYELESVWARFVTTVGLDTRYNEEVTINVTQAFELLNEYKDKFMHTERIDMLNSDIFSLVYVSLFELLHSLLLHTVEHSTVNVEELYKINASKQTVTKFLKSVVEMEEMDPPSKLKFFTLLTVFYRINRYYRVYSGIEFNDPLITILGNIGYNLTSLLKTEEDFKYIDQEFITGLLGGSKSFFAFTGRYDALVDFVNFKDSIAIQNDINVPLIHGSSFLYMLKEPIKPKDENSKYFGDFYKPSILRYIQSNLLLSKFKRTNDLSISRSFQYLVDIISHIDDEKVTTVDPFTFYQIVLIASTYRYMKSKRDIYNSLDTNKKNYVTFGIWLADVILHSLYTQWFDSGKFYDQVERPKYCENRIQTTLRELQKEVIVVAASYLEFIKYLHNSTDFSKIVNTTNYLYKKAFYRSSDKFFSNDDMFNSNNLKTVIADIQLGSSSILYFSLASIENSSFNIINVLKTISNKVMLDTTDFQKIIKSADVRDKVFYDDLLDKLLLVSYKLDKEEFNEFDYLYVSTLPLLNFFFQKSEEKQVGAVFEFTTPEGNNSPLHFEFLVHEHVTKPLTSQYNLILK